MRPLTKVDLTSKPRKNELWYLRFNVINLVYLTVMSEMVKVNQRFFSELWKKKEIEFKRTLEVSLKLSCDSRFTHAFTACSCVFKVITLVWANQRDFFENATACSKRMRKTLVATQLKTLYKKLMKWKVRSYNTFFSSFFFLRR